MLKLPTYVAAVFSADDSGGYSGLQSERASNRKNPIAHMYAAGVAQPDDRQFAVRFNLDHSQVRLFIRSDHLGCVKRRFRVQLHLNLSRLFDDVIIREDESLLVHDYAG